MLVLGLGILELKKQEFGPHDSVYVGCMNHVTGPHVAMLCARRGGKMRGRGRCISGLGKLLVIYEGHRLNKECLLWKKEVRALYSPVCASEDFPEEVALR